MPPLIGPSRGATNGRPVLSAEPRDVPDLRATPSPDPSDLPLPDDVTDRKPKGRNTAGRSAGLTPTQARRPTGLFGRMFGGNESKAQDRGRVVSAAPPVEEESEADAAIKRRVIKQIRENLGGRLSSFDVRVAGRDVQILAKPTRMWQRWGVRNDLQSLPVLKGYRTTVEMVD